MNVSNGYGLHLVQIHQSLKLPFPKAYNIMKLTQNPSNFRYFCPIHVPRVGNFQEFKIVFNTCCPIILMKSLQMFADKYKVFHFPRFSQSRM